MRKLVLHANRNGFFYVLDRTTGEYLRATELIDNSTGLVASTLRAGRFWCPAKTRRRGQLGLPERQGRHQLDGQIVSIPAPACST